VAKSILRRSGYQVIEARQRGRGPPRLRDARGEIDLLLSDVIMTDMGGPELARRLGPQPRIRVLCHVRVHRRRGGAARAVGPASPSCRSRFTSGDG